MRKPFQSVSGSTPSRRNCSAKRRRAFYHSALRVRIHAAIGHDALTHALNDINGLVHPPNDGFYSELEAEKGAVTRLLPTIQFDANPATQPLIQGLQWLHQKAVQKPPPPLRGRAGVGFFSMA